MEERCEPGQSGSRTQALTHCGTTPYAQTAQGYCEGDLCKTDGKPPRGVCYYYRY